MMRCPRVSPVCVPADEERPRKRGTSHPIHKGGGCSSRPSIMFLPFFVSASLCDTFDVHIAQFFVIVIGPGVSICVRRRIASSLSPKHLISISYNFSVSVDH